MRGEQQELRMPNSSTGPEAISSVMHSGIIVVIGANGAGKTRFGAWLENPQSRSGVHVADHTKGAYRIAAQRQLSLPAQAQRQDEATAARNLLNGNDMGPQVSRVSGDPIVGTSSDFAALLSLLFARRALEDRDYSQRSSDGRTSPGEKPKESELSKLKSIWERVFPERRLYINDYEINAGPPNSPRAVSTTSEEAEPLAATAASQSSEAAAQPQPRFGHGTGQDHAYSATNMSDGERVGFYLIGHGLLAPANEVIVIDEPEVHLHPSIQSTLWNEIEAARQDCTFVYITHDLAFAASRRDASIIVLEDYEGSVTPTAAQYWRWRLASSVESVSPEVTLKIMGARRPALFVEGTAGSDDVALYCVTYPDRFVLPSKSCKLVEEAAKAFSKQSELHYLEVAGLIDRDDRDDALVEKLKRNGVYVLPVAAVENLYALPTFIRCYLESVDKSGEDADRVIATIAGDVRNKLHAKRDWAIAERVQFALRKRLQSVRREKGEDSLEHLHAALVAATTGPNLDEMYEAAARTIDDALAEKQVASGGSSIDASFESLLRHFRNKDVILPAVAGVLGIDMGAYKDWVIDSVRKTPTLREHLRRLIGVPGVEPITLATRQQESAGGESDPGDLEATATAV